MNLKLLPDAYKHRVSGAVALFCCLAVAFALSTLKTSSAQSEPLFTQAQAERGKTLYGQQCAVCHGQRLEGTPASPLAGERFMVKWGQGNYTIDDLYFITKTQMPYGKPDSLTPQQYVDVVAFMLASNGYPAGPRELPADSAALKRTKITRQSAGAAPATTGPGSPAPKFISSGERASTTRPTQGELKAARTNATDWLLPNHDYGGQRFVDLKQINRRNAASLEVVASYPVADAYPFHNNPIVYQGVMYVATTNSTMALDATSLKVKWRVDRKPRGADGWPMNRGVALKDGKVIRGTH